MDSIILANANGEGIEVYVLEETMLSGNKYLLVCDNANDAEDAEAFILKEIAEEDADIVYDIVDDDIEFDAVAKLFKELVGDEADIEF